MDDMQIFTSLLFLIRVAVSSIVRPRKKHRITSNSTPFFVNDVVTFRLEEEDVLYSINARVTASSKFESDKILLSASIDFDSPNDVASHKDLRSSASAPKVAFGDSKYNLYLFVLFSIVFFLRF